MVLYERGVIVGVLVLVDRFPSDEVVVDNTVTLVDRLRLLQH